MTRKLTKGGKLCTIFLIYFDINHVLIISVFSASLEIEEKFIYTNMPKLKHLPKTKKQAKYLGPYTVSKVTDSHVTISKDEIGAKRTRRLLATLHVLTLKDALSSKLKRRVYLML